MMRHLLVTGVAGVALAGLAGSHSALVQKQAGILKVYHRDSPASMSILEEATISTVLPMMGVFNNLVVYDQNVKQNSLQSIVPDLTTSWETSEDGTQLTFKLREGVKWHDGKTLHGEGRGLHLGPSARQSAGEAAHQSAQDLVP